MSDWIFACLAPPGEGAREALLLAKSIRHFAGDMAGNPIWVLIPEAGDKLAPHIEAEFRSIHVRLIPFALSEDARTFPFAAKTIAAAAAEALAEDQTPLLVWMDRDSIILQQPSELRLSPGRFLGYRPVDHTLIGSPYDGPVGDFWQLVYSLCGVPAERLFPMIASVDENRIRPYFNAGMLVVRPERHLLRSWAGNFERLFLAPQFEPFYQQDILYRIFMHQAILAGTILAACEQKALHQLSHLINYPLHMHRSYPPDRRPETMNELISCRYDTFFQDSAWEADVVINEPLKGWLRAQRTGI